jgi:hypothetical protein
VRHPRRRHPPARACQTNGVTKMPHSGPRHHAHCSRSGDMHGARCTDSSAHRNRRSSWNSFATR